MGGTPHHPNVCTFSVDECVCVRTSCVLWFGIVPLATWLMVVYVPQNSFKAPTGTNLIINHQAAKG